LENNFHCIKNIFRIAKNSHGDDFNKDGFFHMVRNKNRCGFAEGAVIPIFKKIS
jgi:hypothetical protein